MPSSRTISTPSPLTLGQQLHNLGVPDELVKRYINASTIMANDPRAKSMVEYIRSQKTPKPGRAFIMYMRHSPKAKKDFPDTKPKENGHSR